MSVTTDELERFHDFAVSLISGAGAEMTWLQLFDLWRIENPSAAEYQANLAAVRESLEAMDAGRMRPFSAFDADFRNRHDITSDA
jgi:hypothetical protein